MARYVESSGGSPFPGNAGLDAMTQFNQGMQGLMPIIAQIKQMQQQKQPLTKYLGMSGPEALPESMRSMANVPIGKLAGLREALGGNLAPFLGQQGNVPLFFDPKTKTFGMGQAPEGAIPISGAKAKDAISAVKPPATQSLSDSQVLDIVNRVKKGDVETLNKLPSFGANSPKSRVIAELAHQGFDITGTELDLDAKKAYIRAVNSPAFQNTIKYLRSVNPNMDRVLALSDKMSRTFSKPINRAQLAIMVNSGNKEAAAFGAAAIEVSDQIAKILQGGGTGSGTSDAKLKQAQDILNGNFSVPQLKAVVETMKGLLNERESALKTNTLMTFGNQKIPKIDSNVRFQQLIKQGKSKTQAYEIMHKEGY